MGADIVMESMSRVTKMMSVKRDVTPITTDLTRNQLASQSRPGLDIARGDGKTERSGVFAPQIW